MLFEVTSLSNATRKFYSIINYLNTIKFPNEEEQICALNL
jgi:hypothetical protein